MGTDPGYVPCQCPKCRHRPLYGLCRCRFCKGDRPQDVREATDARRKSQAVQVAGRLLAAADERDLSEEEELELNRALAYLTRN